MSHQSYLEQPYDEQANLAAAVEDYLESNDAHEDAIEWFCHTLSREDRVQMFQDLGGADFDWEFENWHMGVE